MNNEMINIEEALVLSNSVISAEKSLILLCDELLKKITVEGEKTIILEIKEHSTENIEFLENLYLVGTGKESDKIVAKIDVKNDYKDILETLLFSKIKLIKDYRKIYSAMSNQKDRTQVFSSISNTSIDCDLINYLISK